MKISQCMIVKNEEKNIEKALSWGKGIVSEQIVVDTGSMDRTVELAEKLGATVYHFPWIDDFAAAKNFAIDKAAGEWIAFLDADEYFTQEDAAKLLDCIESIQGLEYEGILTGWVHLDQEGKVMAVQSQIRVFRNLPELRYHRRIHEYLRVSGTRSVRMADMADQLSVYHTGYSREASQKKVGSQRNFLLLKRELEDNPRDYELHGLLGNEYVAMDQLEEAEQCYRKSIELMPDQAKGVYDITTSGIWYRLLEIQIVRREADERELLEVYHQATKGWPEEGDYDYLMGKYYVSCKNYGEAEIYLRKGLNLLEQYGNTAKSSFLSGDIMKAYELLAICCFNNNHLQDCVQLTSAMLKENPYLMSTLTVLLTALLRDPGTGGRGREGAMEAAVFLGNHFYDYQSMKDRLFVLRGALGAGYQDLVDIIKGTFTPQELAVVEQALEREQKTSQILKEGTDDSQNQEQQGKPLRIVLFDSYVESFNFFTDQLEAELKARGHETFTLDLRDEGREDSETCLKQFAERKIDAVIGFDALGVRSDHLNDLWNRHGAAAVDIFMDPPLRFHPALENPPENYCLFCCDREHVDYVKQYFGHKVPKADFMPHVGVLPEAGSRVIPYRERSYDILFCGTYYRPEDKMAELKGICPEDSDAYHLYQKTFENLKKNSNLSIWKGMLFTIEELGWYVPEPVLKQMFSASDCVDWAIRMYQRERVVTALAEAGLTIHLLGRGWEKHPCAGLPNVHRIDDRIPYGDTLAYMADARINLNVMPGFKEGTHDRIFNTLLQRSVPLTDSSSWIRDNFTDGVDIALYDLDRLELLPEIARRLLADEGLAERIIENGYSKVAGAFTWSHCADRILETVRGR